MRDYSIDTVRGLCIVSMIIGHMSMGSILFSLSHIPLWTDAAFGFVFLSGLVLGIVHRKKTKRAGSPDYRGLVRRAVLLYVVQFAILVLALVVGAIDGGSHLPDAGEFGGWANSFALVASLQLPAPNLTILPMYVVLLLLAVGVLALLSRRKPWIAMALSAVIYVIAIIFPEHTVMPFLAQHPAAQFNWAAWQLPFVGALVLGWNWADWEARKKVLSRPMVLAAALLAAVILVTAQLVERLRVLAGTPAEPVVDLVFAKWDLGPGAILYGVCGLVLLYWVVEQVAHVTWTHPLRNVLTTVGQKSLDSFVILCLAVILLPAIFNYSQDSVVGMVSAFLVFGICWVWARQRISRRSQAPARNYQHDSVDMAQ